MSGTDDDFPQAGRKRLILPSPIGTLGTGARDIEPELYEEMQRGAVYMMGDNPALPRMPEEPRLLDFYRLRFGSFARRHHCQSAKLAMEAGQPEKVIMACFLHDISNGALVRCDHGYWSAQLIAPCGNLMQRLDELVAAPLHVQGVRSDVKEAALGKIDFTVSLGEHEVPFPLGFQADANGQLFVGKELHHRAAPLCLRVCFRRCCHAILTMSALSAVRCAVPSMTTCQPYCHQPLGAPTR